MPQHRVRALALVVACIANLLPPGSTTGTTSQPTDAGLWLDERSRPTPSARVALNVLEGADADGLAPEDYGVSRLLLLNRRMAETPDPGDALAFDSALTAGFVLYLEHLRHGRLDGAGSRDRDARAALHRSLRDAVANNRLAGLVAAMTPSRMHYRELRDALRQYRMLAANPSLSDVPAFSGTVHPGDRSTGLPALHRLLLALGDLPPGHQPPTDAAYEEPLVSAVRRFQGRHGLDQDGVIGKATSEALRVPMGARVRQIELALERIRALGDVGDQKTIVLNIPMFRIWGWEAGAAGAAPTISMRAIVGAVRTPTPVLEADIRRVVFRPYWNVPRSILVGELLPLIRSNPDYVARHRMEIVRGEGDTSPVVPTDSDSIAQLGRGLLRLRQRPGPDNALGLVKLQIESEAGVHMHGTPSQQLFERARRDFSHGCIRVEYPAALAEWALDDPVSWSRERIEAATTGLDNRDVPLPSPLRASLFYATAAFNADDGTVSFANDIYRLDADLEQALTRRPAVTPW